MPILESLIGPVAAIIDKVIPDKAARERAKLELIKLEGSQELDALKAQLSAIVAGSGVLVALKTRRPPAKRTA